MHVSKLKGLVGLVENWPVFLHSVACVQGLSCFDSLCAFLCGFTGRKVLGLGTGRAIQGTAWSLCCDLAGAEAWAGSGGEKAPEKMRSEFLGILDSAQSVVDEASSASVGPEGSG